MTDRFDQLAYEFWSLHPADIPEPVGMPQGYPGGGRAWFYSVAMRVHFKSAIAEAEARGYARGVEDAAMLAPQMAYTPEAYIDAAIRALIPAERTANDAPSPGLASNAAAE